MGRTIKIKRPNRQHTDTSGPGRTVRNPHNPIPRSNEYGQVTDRLPTGGRLRNRTAPELPIPDDGDTVPPAPETGSAHPDVAAGTAKAEQPTIPVSGEASPSSTDHTDALPPDLVVDVIISTSDQRAAYEHDLQLRNTLVRRLQKRQLQAARLGDSADPSIEMEIEDLQQEVAQLDAQIASVVPSIDTLPDRAVILSAEQQREAVLALSRITGVPPDKIRLVDIVIGSVVLMVDMSLAGAARLVAMQRLNHPMLREQGFANIALDRVVDTQGQPLDSMFERAVRFEEVELNATTPPSAEASPYAGVDAAARLRITLADDAVRHT